MTTPLYYEDAYNQNFDAQVISVNEHGGIILDKTLFYPAKGGQPGDSGKLTLANGETVDIATTVYDEDGKTIIHVPQSPIEIAENTALSGMLNWETRYKHMRMHTALHLLCALVPYPVTGGQIGADASRLDFDIENAETIDKATLTEQLNALIQQDHEVTSRMITDEELDNNPDLVRTMAVKPPRGTGFVRLVAIGDEGKIDLQPCGGTHVKTTQEIGTISVTKIEKKGKRNRRVRIAFA